VSDPATFWEQHLAGLADHEWGLFTAIERRAQILAGLSASVVGGLTLIRFHGDYQIAWEELSWLASAEATLGLAASVVATLVFAATLTPLEGRSLPRGSAASQLRTLVDRVGPQRLLGSTTLSEEVRAACRREEVAVDQAQDSEAARRLVGAWLQRRVGADLDWWLAPLDGAGCRTAQVRFRLAMHYWATRQAVHEKGRLLGLGMNVALSGTALLTAAALTAWSIGLGVIAILVPALLVARRFL